MIDVFQEYDIKPIGRLPTDEESLTRLVRQAFQRGFNTATMAGMFGYPESQIERWLHRTARE